MDLEEWKESVREWKEGYRKALEDWRERFRDWKAHAESSVSEAAPPMPPMPPIHIPMPPLRIMPFRHAHRGNVVASRMGDEELRVIDLLVEAGLFSTRSEAVAYFVSEGIKARKEMLSKVTTALEDIRRIRKEAEDHVAKLKKDIGLAEPKEPEAQERICPGCHKSLSDLPEDIAVCPYCGRRLERD